MSHLHSPAPAPGAGVRQAVPPRQAPGLNGVQVLRAPGGRGDLPGMRGVVLTGGVASVTQPFCRTCNRARLSAEGKLYTCLFAVKGHDFRDLMRGGATDDEISQAIARVGGKRGDRYSEIRSEKTTSLPKVEMSHIGG